MRVEERSVLPLGKILKKKKGAEIKDQFQYTHSCKSAPIQVNSCLCEILKTPYKIIRYKKLYLRPSSLPLLQEATKIPNIKPINRCMRISIVSSQKKLLILRQQNIWLLNISSRKRSSLSAVM